MSQNLICRNVYFYLRLRQHNLGEVEATDYSVGLCLRASHIRNNRYVMQVMLVQGVTYYFQLILKTIPIKCFIKT